jgi:hypothetical protein
MLSHVLQGASVVFQDYNSDVLSTVTAPNVRLNVGVTRSGSLVGSGDPIKQALLALKCI